jgi:hydroxymethylpyrimidine/phosphomethylpyrimidine kinase
VEALVRQIDSIAEDLNPDAVKTGMLFSAEMIEAVAERVKRYQWHRLVVDPVMIAKGGAPLLQPEAVDALIRHLIPIAYVVTPNIPEAETIAGMRITTLKERKEAAKKIVKMGAKHVVIKGGHDTEETVIDLFYDGVQFVPFSGRRIRTKHTHGTGCTFSAAITAELAKGKEVLSCIATAKQFIQAAIEEELAIGQGHGPTNHWAFRKREGNRNEPQVR